MRTHPAKFTAHLDLAARCPEMCQPRATGLAPVCKAGHEAPKIYQPAGGLFLARVLVMDTCRSGGSSSEAARHAPKANL